MSKNIQESLDSCLFFTVKKMDRALNKLAAEAFQTVGMAPTDAFILLILAEEDGRLQKDIAQILSYLLNKMVVIPKHIIKIEKIK